jgi:hypothetical protein
VGANIPQSHTGAKTEFADGLPERIMGPLRPGSLDGFFQGVEADLPFVQARDVFFVGDLPELFVTRLNRGGHGPIGVGLFVMSFLSATCLNCS